MSSTHRFHNVAANRSPKGFDLLGAVDPVAGLDGLSELAEHLRSSGRVEICSTTRQDSTDSTHHRTLGEIGILLQRQSEPLRLHVAAARVWVCMSRRSSSRMGTARTEAKRARVAMSRNMLRVVR